jgi:hypothetical protein
MSVIVIAAYVALIVAGAAACEIRRWLGSRRKDREWAATVARCLREAAYLDWLEDEFTAIDAGER